MRRLRSTWISLALLCFALGAWLVFYSVRADGFLAQVSVLLGGVFFGLSGFSAYMTVQQYLQLRALDRHLHPHNHHRHSHPSAPTDT